MKLDFSGERILAVIAHPDDAELLCAGTLARAKREGAEAIGLCVLCNGDKGQPEPPLDDLGEVRHREMAAAADLLGAELFWMGHGDAELSDTPPARREVIEVFRRFRPGLILAHSSRDYHPDHRAASQIADAASWFCASRGHLTASPPLASPPALWWMDTVEMHHFEPGFYLDISGFVDLKTRMLRCHRSQLARAGDGSFSPLEEVMIRQAHVRGAQCGVNAAEAFRIHRAWKRTAAW
jgi:LmbE family N-acetylglucosaminyl deacetylase